MQIKFYFLYELTKTSPMFYFMVFRSYEIKPGIKMSDKI